MNMLPIMRSRFLPFNPNSTIPPHNPLHSSSQPRLNRLPLLPLFLKAPQQLLKHLLTPSLRLPKLLISLSITLPPLTESPDLATRHQRLQNTHSLAQIQYPPHPASSNPITTYPSLTSIPPISSDSSTTFPTLRTDRKELLSADFSADWLFWVAGACNLERIDLHTKGC